MAVIDWFSQAGLFWELPSRLSGDFCCTALERALRKYGKPIMFKPGLPPIASSTSSSTLDNVFIEPLWSTVKYEEV
jgi:hypothetical protein